VYVTKQLLISKNFFRQPFIRWPTSYGFENESQAARPACPACASLPAECSSTGALISNNYFKAASQRKRAENYLNQSNQLLLKDGQKHRFYKK
jgi:hypothetical protein